MGKTALRRISVGWVFGFFYLIPLWIFFRVAFSEFGVGPVTTKDPAWSRVLRVKWRCTSLVQGSARVVQWRLGVSEGLAWTNRIFRRVASVEVAHTQA